MAKEMKTRFDQPRPFYQRTRARFGLRMEEYPVQKQSHMSCTNFEELEQIRNLNRTNDHRYQRIYEVLIATGLTAFGYAFLRLTQADIIAIFFGS